LTAIREKHLRTSDRPMKFPYIHKVYTGTYPNFSSFTKTQSSANQPANWFSRSEIVTSPSWARRIKDPTVFVPPTNYAHESHVQTPYQGYFLIRNPGSFQVINGNISGGLSNALTLTTLPSHLSSLRDQAVTKALKRLKNQNIDLSIAFLERKKTSAHLLKTAIAFKKSLTAVKKGNMAGAARALKTTYSGKGKIEPPRGKEIVNRWNELQHGWKPMLNDVQGACRAIAERDAEPYRYRISVKGFKKQTSVSTTTFTSNAKFSESCMLVQRCGCRLFYTVPDTPALSLASSLGLTNPFSTAYEFVPFSFILDYVLPIGDFLSVMDAALPFTFLGGFTTEVTEIRTVGIVESFNNIDVMGSAKCYKHRSDRTSLSASPFPHFPAFRQANTSQVANAMAIFSSLFG